MSKRVGVYIDGFNLYFSIKRKAWRECYWYDPYELASSLCRANEQLTFCKYFTARVANNADKQKRQATYLDALALQSKAEIFFGRYKEESHKCASCYATNLVPKEKKTDVNIAVQILRDAFENHWDRIVLISGDSDLVPPLEAVKELFPEKTRTVFFPPEQFNNELARLNSGTVAYVGKDRLIKATLPEVIMQSNGFPIERPQKWK